MKEGKFLIVILDSNIFTADFHMAGNNFKLLIDFLRRTDNKLVVPKIVLLEVKHNFENELKKAQKKIQHEIDNLKRRIGNIHLDNPLTNEFLKHEHRSYCKQFEKKLIDIDAEILEHPNISHEFIAKRAVYKKKPFKQNGDGYRDLLIWESIINLLQSQEKPVILVTKNTKDFCSSNNNSLHEDLKMDLIQRKVSNNKLFLYGDLKMFLEDFVLPKFDKNNEFKEKIVKNEYPFENINNLISLKISEVLENPYSDANEIYFEKEFEMPRLFKIYAIHNLKVKDVRKISEKEVYISLEVINVVTFED